MKYVIIGAGPAGLSAGWHLLQRGINDFLIIEKEKFSGGLSATFTDKSGFSWDLGGHVLFDNGNEFIKLGKELLGKNLIRHERNAVIYFQGNYLPYPFQDNFNRLQGPTLKNIKPENFKEWLQITFGKKLCDDFFVPQNEKSWVYPLDKMSYSWTEKRIKLPTKIKNNKWGDNAGFWYPKTGGIGIFWSKLADKLSDKIRFNCNAVKADFVKHQVILNNYESIKYDRLISSMPLDLLTQDVRLKHNSGLVIGLGIKGKLNYPHHWVYYPQRYIPFFRLVFPSNFSGVRKNHCSILAEIALKPGQNIGNKLTKSVIENILKLDLFTGNIISQFEKHVSYFYPIPTLDRDIILTQIRNNIVRYDAVPIGRFGGWRYETGNMDDAFREGKETVED